MHEIAVARTAPVTSFSIPQYSSFEWHRSFASNAVVFYVVQPLFGWVITWYEYVIFLHIERGNDFVPSHRFKLHT